MENSRFLSKSKFLLLVTGIFFIAPFFVSAYADKTAHPALTIAVADFYNKNFPNQKLSAEDKNLMAQGSIDEDAFGRWMRHFYDPVYKKGLDFGQIWQSSKEWAQDHKSQASLDIKMTLLAAIVKPFDGSTDFSWERSVYEYTWGDKKRGLIGLGHVLHLLEDATVPDHTREDVHVALVGNGSPYEDWTAQFNPGNLNMSATLNNQKPINRNSLSEYFEVAATYSNNNFFSRDTIASVKYYAPKILKESSESIDGKSYRFGYGINEFGKEYRLVKIEKRFGDNKTEYSIEDKGNLVLSDYWSRLSEQAVLNGAGVVKLFFDEVEKEKKLKMLLGYNKSKPEKMVSAIVNSFYSPTLKQAQWDPELAEDLGLPIPLSPSKSEQIQQAQLEASIIKDMVADKDETKFVGVQPPMILSSPAPVLPPKLAITTPIISMSGGGGGGASDESTHPLLQPAPQPSIPTASASESSPSIADDTNDEPPPASPPPDTDAPDISYNILACDNSVANNGCLLYFGASLEISWLSNASDLSSYTVECMLGGASCSGFPLVDVTSTSTIADLTTTGLYSFIFKAKDTAGNIGTASKQLEINPRPVVINELAWMGTAADANDEWIELFNASSFNILLGDGSTTTPAWSLIATDNSPSISLNGTIASGGFFVLERTSSTATSYDENQIFTGAINDPVGSPGDDLTLKDPAGTVIDNTSINALTGQGAKTPQRKTAERINPSYASADATSNAYNWRTTVSTGSVVTDKNGTAILGTPGSQNSVYNTNWRPTYISDTAIISTDTTWVSSNSPYILHSNSNKAPQVASGVTLTIEPGTVIMAKNKYYPSLNVYGALKAKGTSSNSIVFTSFTDSDYGGTGGAQKGSWSRIKFSPASIGNSLEYVKYRYAGYYQGVYQPSLEVASDATLTIDNSLFEQNYSSVLDLIGSGFGDVIVKNSTFSNNGNSSTGSNFAVIRTSDGASPTIANNIFSSNSIYPIVIKSSYPNISANIASANPLNGIFVSATSVFDSNVRWLSNLSYVLELGSSQRPTVSLGATLTIDPGVVLKPFTKNYEPLRIDGVLNWVADAANPGVVTSFADDTYGGDADNDVLTLPQVNDWQPIHFTNTAATSTISNIKFRYGVTGSELNIDIGASVDQVNVVSEP